MQKRANGKILVKANKNPRELSTCARC